MLFKRREKLSLTGHLKKYIQAGLAPRRTLLYLKHRILRLPHSTRDVSLGLALGVAVSWTPLLGLHIIQAFIFSILMRANFPAAVIGTLIGNPWTFPFMFWLSYVVGNQFIEWTHFDRFIEVQTGFAMFEQQAFGISAFFPTLIGGYIMALITVPIAYYSFYYFIAGARKAKERVGSTVHKIKEKRKSKK